MRKSHLLTLLFILSLTGMEARMRFVRIGFQSGPALSTVYGSPLIETFMKSELRFSAGPSLYIPFSKRISMKSNLFFETKGAAGIMPFYERGKNKGLFNTVVKYNYVTVPLLFNLTFGRQLKFEVSTGPYVGLLISQKTTWMNPEGGESIDVRDMSVYRPGDAGWILGTGVWYHINKRVSLNMEVRMNVGLSNIASKPVMSSYSVSNMSNVALLGIHYTPGYMAGKMRRTWEY